MPMNEGATDPWSDPSYLADLNGGFLITERIDDDLLLTFNLGGVSSYLWLDGFFATHSGPGFGAETPGGILDDEAAVPILAALFSQGAKPAARPDCRM